MRHRAATGLAVLFLLGVAAAAEPPDFAGTIVTRKLAPAAGKRRVLAILWDPKRGYTPDAAAIDSLIFGPRPSVADWFRENSNGKLVLERAGCVGWIAAAKKADHYWQEPRADGKPLDQDGFVHGHLEKWTEAIVKAAATVDLASFDDDKDGVLAPHELAVLVVIPQRTPFGSNRVPAAREVPKWEPLVVKGVRIPAVAEVYTGEPPNLGVFAHELAHLILGAPDLYHPEPWPWAAGGYSLMDSSYTTGHLDPLQKLKLGWLSWTAVTRSREIALKDVETTGSALVLHDPDRGPGEYFLVENRWRGKSYDAGVPGAGGGIKQDGLAIWHVLEDPALFRKFGPPAAHPDEWGRRGLRLVRRNGGGMVDDAQALLDTQGLTLGDDTWPARLRWADGKATGFQVSLLSAPGPEVRVGITVRRWR